MPKVWNKRDKNCPKDAVYVGRPSRWGNPFKIGAINPGTGEKIDRAKAIELYRAYITCHCDLISELKGKDLVCWCSPKPCHADVLLELANK